MGSINLNESVKKRNQLSKARQKGIESFYKRLAKQVAKESEGLDKITFKAQYLKRIEKELTAQVAAFNTELTKSLKDDMLKTAESVVADNQSWINKTGLGIKAAYNHIPAETVESILTGQVYNAKWSLDSTIWQDTKKFSRDINKVIAEGVALNKSTYDIAKDLEMYVDPSAAKPWDWNKVYPGVRKKVDYNAQRLARTMVQHAYQQTLENALKDNPFNKGIKWRSALITKRTCQLCRDRHNQVFPKGKLPIDHPNGLCTFIPVMDDLDDVASQLADWVNGKENKDIDNWVNSMREPKSKRNIVDAPKQIKTKFQNAIEELAQDSRGGMYTEETIRKAGRLVQEELIKQRAAVKGQLDKTSEQIKALGYRDIEGKIIQHRKVVRGLMEFHELGYSTYEDCMEALSKLNSIGDSLRPKHRELESNMLSLLKKYRGNTFENASELKSLLSDIRSMGLSASEEKELTSHLHGKSPTKEVLKQAYQHYPTSWIRSSTAYGGLAPKKVDRGFYDHAYAGRVSDIGISGYNTEEQFKTAIHELGHRFERTMAGLLEVESEFYNRRTAEDEFTWLGNGYSRAEVAKFDNFLDPYMGKNYDGRAYELASMGFDLAFTQPTRLWEDKEYAEWIYGLLALL